MHFKWYIQEVTSLVGYKQHQIVNYNSNSLNRLVLYAICSLGFPSNPFQILHHIAHLSLPKYPVQPVSNLTANRLTCLRKNVRLPQSIYLWVPWEAFSHLSIRFRSNSMETGQIAEWCLPTYRKNFFLPNYLKYRNNSTTYLRSIN